MGGGGFLAFPKQGSPSMARKVVVVTGANAGIGRETTRRLVKEGARVVMACRNVDAAQEVAAAIRAEGWTGQVEVGPALDLADERSIGAWCSAFLKNDRLDVLLLRRIPH